MSAVTFPRRGRGRMGPDAQARYDEQVSEFCDYIREIRSRLDFDVSSRGWCYILENKGAVTKDEFDSCQEFINTCRKRGLLPLDICGEDAKRAWQHVEEIDSSDPEREANRLISSLQGWIQNYRPVSYWDDKSVYIELLVEKSDLVSLFSPVCERYYVPIANAGGNADINQRAHMMERFAEHEQEGRQPVLLYCGDHDPAGLRISDYLHDNLRELADAVDWDPDGLEIERFGLNADFIEAHSLTWVDNLITGSGGNLADPRHPDHRKSYVQDYLHEFGARKVEANALVVAPDDGRQLCRAAILKWMGGKQEAPMEYRMKLEPHRAELLLKVREALVSV